ncbi:MAG: TIGR03088 family PEP-CTERM/XrtA system glycosyltransferase [Gammaproteobacteria bacterium]
MPAPLIAHIVHRLDYGGLENGLVNLINGLPADSYRHVIICLTEASDFRRRVRRPDVDVHELHKAPGKDPAAYLRLWRLLRQLKPAAVHTRNTGVIDCLVVARLAGVPHRIHGYHGWDVDDLTGTDPGRHRLRKLCDPFVDRYVVVSRQIGAWVTGTLGVATERVTHICNGVDVERFLPLPEPKSAGEPVMIGTVGRLQAVKNQILLVRACGLLLRQAPQLAGTWQLRIIGDGPERRALDTAIDQEGLRAIASITGWNDDVPQALRTLGIFVLPSLNEGISNTILEAMASGLPVIATAVGGSPELVVDSETGFLIPADDPAALADRLLRYLDSPALVSKHGRAARERAEREFSIRRMLLDYARLYRDVIDPSNPR